MTRRSPCLAALSSLAWWSSSALAQLPTLPEEPPAEAAAPAPAAPAQPPPPLAVPPSPSERAPSVLRGPLRFGAELGWRGQRITSAGYDPYSRDDWHGFSSLSGWFVAWRSGPWSVAATAGWDVGVSTAAARGQETSLALHRLWLAPEGRMQLGRLGHVLLRVGPSVWHMRGQLSDDGLAAPLVRRPWKVGADAALGARARVLELRDARGAWSVGYVGLELGYSYVPKISQQLDPKPSAVEPRDVRGLRLPTLDASGVTVRLAVSGAF